MTVQRQPTDISDDVETHLSKMVNKRVCCSLAVDKSTAITSTAQMSIFS
jgi:hypothetical protein